MIVKSIKDLLPVISNLQEKLGLNARQSYTEVYRGQSLFEYKLTPGISRYKHPLNEILKREKMLAEKFVNAIKNKEIEFIQEPYVNQHKGTYQKEWFYLIQGQHLGLKTRLMDWTLCWETALLFAVENEKYFGMDGQFWIYLCPKNNFIHNDNIEIIYSIHPLEVTSTYLINQPFYQPDKEDEYISEHRRARQYGRFLIQESKNILTPLEDQPEMDGHLWKFIIDGNSKKRIKSELMERGHVIEWKYYRKSDNIEEKINKINEIMD
ncbi:MAG: FRG domain-containing protein [Bacteroidales bacterium]|nr:FRG domain-containing protein [Bacteroidales bacterium]MCF8456102.1 FRG domain-containing protein [Bacteroidales bacterium]